MAKELQAANGVKEVPCNVRNQLFKTSKTIQARSSIDRQSLLGEQCRQKPLLISSANGLCMSECVSMFEHVRKSKCAPPSRQGGLGEGGQRTDASTDCG